MKRRSIIRNHGGGGGKGGGGGGALLQMRGEGRGIDVSPEKNDFRPSCSLKRKKEKPGVACLTDVERRAGTSAYLHGKNLAQEVWENSSPCTIPRRKKLPFPPKERGGRKSGTKEKGDWYVTRPAPWYKKGGT